MLNSYSSHTLKLDMQILFAILFSVFFVYIPWDSLRGVPFEDLDVYVNKFSVAGSIFDGSNESGVAWYFTNEVLWDVFVRFLAEYINTSVDNIFRIISFVTIFALALFLIKRTGVFFLFLLNPLVVDLVISQVRTALALTILLMALTTKSRLTSIVLSVLAPMIHTASVLFIGYYLIGRFSPALLGWIGIKNKMKYVYFFVAIATCIIIGPTRQLILEYFGDRRAAYEVPASSIAYSSFWLVLAAFMYFQPKRYFNNPLNVVALVCSLVFVIGTTLSIPTVRFVAATFPFAVISIYQLDHRSKLLFLPFAFAFFTFQWIYWFQAI